MSCFRFLRPLVLLSLAALTSASPCRGQGDGAAPAIPPEVQRFRALLIEANNLNIKKRYAEALEHLAEAEALKQDEALVHNMRGSIQTGLRDLVKARESFNKALELKPSSFEPKFNLAELDYIEARYQEAGTAFQQLLKDFPKLPLQARHLTTFKVLVCQLKQNLMEEAAATAKSFTFMDDTPAYYYGKAAFAFQKDNRQEAQEWLDKAERIFKTEDVAPYIDSLLEARWLDHVAVPLLKP